MERANWMFRNARDIALQGNVRYMWIQDLIRINFVLNQSKRVARSCPWPQQLATEHLNGCRPTLAMNMHGDWDNGIPTFSERIADMNERAENPRIYQTIDGDVMHPADRNLVAWKREDHIDEFSTADVVEGLFDDSDYGDGHIPLAQLIHTETSLGWIPRDKHGKKIGAMGIGSNPQMGQLDRMISETGYRGNALCSVPYHVISDGKVMWMRQEWVANKTGLPLHNADQLVQAMIKLDFTQQMANSAIRTIAGPDRIRWETVSRRSGAMMGYGESGQAYMLDILNAAVAVDALIDEARAEEEERRAAEHEFMYDSEGYIIEVDGERLDDFEWTRWNAIDDDRGQMPKQNPAFRYVPIGITERDFAPDWINSQPRPYVNLLREIRECKDLKEFGNIGWRLFNREMKKWNKAQQGVLWSYYKARRIVLYKQQKTRLLKILQWINTTPKKMGDVSRMVTRAKLEGKIRFSNEMFTVVYAAIFKRAGQYWFNWFLGNVKKYRKGGV